MPSDGVRLAGEVLGEALLPGVRVLPDPGAAASHQVLRAEAAAAARSARLPWPSPSLVQREPEGRRKGGVKEGAGNPAGREAALSFPFSILPCRTDLSGPACGSPRLFILVDLLPHSPTGEGTRPGAFSWRLQWLGGGISKD